MRLSLFWLLAPLLVVLLACTRSSTQPASPAKTCTKAGDQCEYAPGKLGLCTASSMECDGGGSCLVCMSLH